MLTRSFYASRTFQLRRKLLLRLPFQQYTQYLNINVPKRQFETVIKKSRCPLEGPSFSKSLRRSFSNKDPKILDGKPVIQKSASPKSSTATSSSPKIEPSPPKIVEILESKIATTEVPVKQSLDKEKPLPHLTETKKFDIKTSSGILTITTTIEDSKINEVVLEKATPEGIMGKTKIVSEANNTITGTIIPSIKTQESPNLSDTLVNSSMTSKQNKNLKELTKDTISKKLKKITSKVNQIKESSSLTTEASPSSPSAITNEPVKGTVKSEDTATAAASAAPALPNLLNEKPPPSKEKVHPNEENAKESLLNPMRKVEKVAAKVAAAAAAAVSQATATASEPPKPKKRSRVDFNRSSLERNFVTPNRAMSDFLLKASDLESLPKIKRRSPYEQEPPITVYWRKDVEAKAIEVWGSRENLLKETLKREVDRKKHQQNIFTVKRRLREYRREIGYRTKHVEEEAMGLEGKSGRVVLIAIGINGLNFIFKVIAWLYSGSHSMFAEAIHSLADTTNQCILAYGIHKSVQMADSDHPYGYANMRHVSSLISGVGIFCVGCGLSMYHGIMGLIEPQPLHDLFWPFCILGGSLVSEGATLMVALNKLKRSAKKDGVTLKQYILSAKDPCVNVVLTEDAAAVASVAVAASCMALTTVTGSPIFDAVGSLLVGGILGGVASFIIYTNSSALVGKSISEDLLEKINSELESDCMIRAIYDVKGIHMGNSLIRYKAELDFDGRELSRYYLEKQDINELFKIVKSFQSADELEQFLLTHGENIVDLMGGEIDRIEMKLRSKFPEIRHCDLEVL